MDQFLEVCVWGGGLFVFLVVSLALRNDLLLEVRSAPILPEDVEDYAVLEGN